MPRITVLPHEVLCPEGREIDTVPGVTLSEVLRAHHIEIEKTCEGSCVCTSCHVIIRNGFSAVRPASDAEEDQLGKAWGLEAGSRLSCQVRVPSRDLVIEIPRYTLNFVGERASGERAS